MGVEPARVGQQPDPGVPHRDILRADGGAGRVERHPVGGDPDDREPRAAAPRPPARAAARPPARTSSSVSSSARAVARATMLVIPRPSPRSSSCSAGRSRRGVKPERCSAGQNRLPGRPKWCPVSAVTRPGLMPQNSTAHGGSSGPGSTSGTVSARAASSSARVGRGTHATLAHRNAAPAHRVCRGCEDPGLCASRVRRR